MYRTLPLLLLAAIVSVSLFSCMTEKKISTTKKKLAELDSVLVIQKKTLKEIDEQRKFKQELNEMDDTSSNRINKYINRTQAEIDKMIAENSVLIGETIVERSDWERLITSFSFSRKTSRKIDDKIEFLADLIKQNPVVKIDQDVLFEPGSYIVTPDVAEVINKLFEPAATEINRFTKKYPDFKLSLVITAKGYADATTIGTGTPLYMDLKEKMKLSGKEPDNKSLNKELSNARAKEVIELFKKFSASRSSNKNNLKNVLYLHEGRGEQYPNPKITDYRPDDARRRVVYLFWSVFPD